MPIPVSCEMCFAEWTVPARAAGKRVKCPECGELDREATENERQRRATRAGEQKSERDDWQKLIDALEAALQEIGA